MACLYITENKANVKVKDGKFVIECKDGLQRLIPEEIVESIVVMGNITMTLQAQKKCLKKGINVTYLSTKGQYYGRLVSTSHIDAARLKKQVYVSDNENLRVDFAKRTLGAKIHNQSVLLRRYARNSKVDVSEEIKKVLQAEHAIQRAVTIEKLEGYEGIAARNYFHALSKLIDPAFHFSGRSKRPPKDAFNSMLSLGYTILFYEIYAEIENRSLSPYIGMVHAVRDRHPALVSDMLEEWRSVIVDSTVMSLVQGKEVSIEEFTSDEKSGAVIIDSSAMRKLLNKLEKKMRSSMNYLPYLKNAVTFRRGIWWQCKSFATCIDSMDFSEYQPMRIR